MVYQGALGTTAQCFANTLKVPQAKSAAEGYNAIMKRLNSVENVTLLMANKIYVMTGFTLSENFKTVITKDFFSYVEMIDFGRNEVAAKTINDWVKEQTHEKIQNLFSQDDLDDSTRIVLINAIYFKGNWRDPFELNNTKTESFYLNNKDKIDVQMMHTTQDFNYKNDNNLGAQIFVLPYTNRDLSMIIILPHEKNGINELEKKLAKVNLTDVFRELDTTTVKVSLPRFKIEVTIDLKIPLTKIGLGEIFQVNANFEGMFENAGGNMCISSVVQKAFIEVNEKGAEAAAATQVTRIEVCGISRWPFPVIHFLADHPFIIILSEKENNLLFIGRISNPINNS